MITATVKKKITSTLGKQYSRAIIARLVENEIFNENNEPYSPASIQMIVNGQRENLDVELEILALVSETLAFKKKLKKETSKILKNQ